MKVLIVLVVFLYSICSIECDCSSQNDCSSCISSADCVWCRVKQLANETEEVSVCLNGGATGSSSESKQDCKDWYWLQCNLSGGAFHTKYTYPVIGLFVILLLLSAMGVIILAIYRSHRKPKHRVNQQQSQQPAQPAQPEQQEQQEEQHEQPEERREQPEEGHELPPEVDLQLKRLEEKLVDLPTLDQPPRWSFVSMPLIDQVDEEEKQKDITRKKKRTIKSELEMSIISGEGSANFLPSAPPIERDCIICYGRSKNALLAPCGHVILCQQCANELKRAGQPCPICREKVENVYRVYIE